MQHQRKTVQRYLLSTVDSAHSNKSFSVALPSPSAQRLLLPALPAWLRSQRREVSHRLEALCNIHRQRQPSEPACFIAVNASRCTQSGRVCYVANGSQTFLPHGPISLALYYLLHHLATPLLKSSVDCSRPRQPAAPWGSTMERRARLVLKSGLPFLPGAAR